MRTWMKLSGAALTLFLFGCPAEPAKKAPAKAEQPAKAAPEKQAEKAPPKPADRPEHRDGAPRREP